MKECICAALILALFWMTLPLLTATESSAAPDVPFPIQTETSPAVTECSDPPVSAPAEAVESTASDARFFLPVQREGVVVSMDLHTYLTGVLLGEMPPTFDQEALKAQAVASRTFALRRYENRRHGAAAVCTDPGCCQCWVDPATVPAAQREAAEQAVSDTDGLAIYYQGQLIEATFFACSGGRTEAAAAVWGGDLPYLQPVDSPGEESAAHYTDELRLPLEEFRDKLCREDPAAEFPAALGGWVGSISYTPGGGVETIVLGGRPFAGTQLRTLFGLRSTVFTLTLTDEEAIFSTRGYGHRVGMSQSGAQAMALTGKSFREILEWYYQGIEVKTF